MGNVLGEQAFERGSFYTTSLPHLFPTLENVCTQEGAAGEEKQLF